MIQIFKYLLSLSQFLFLISCVSHDLETPSETKSALEPKLRTTSNTVDAVICRIGQEIILFSELQKAIEEKNGFLLPTGQVEKMSLADAQGILDQLVLDKLILIKIKDQKITLTEEELTQRINDFLKRQGASAEELEKTLTARGQSMQGYRNDFRFQVERELLIGKMISPFVTADPKDVEDYFYETTKPKKIVSSIVLRSLRIDHDLHPNLKERIKLIEEKIAQKQHFEGLILEYSDALDKEESKGLLPPKPLEDFPSEIQASATLEAGHVFGPLEIGSSTFFFEYVESKHNKNPDFETHFDEWKQRYLNSAMYKRFREYLISERSKIQISYQSMTLAS